MLFPAVYDLGFRAGQAFQKYVSWQQQQQESFLVVSFPELLQQGWDAITTFPTAYMDWWLNLVMKDPLHVCVETTLLVSIIYMIASRSTEGYKRNQQDKLTDAESEELIQEWKRVGRMPLASPTDVDEDDDDEDSEDDYDNKGSSKNGSDYDDNDVNMIPSRYKRPPEVVVHKQHGRFMEIEYIVSKQASKTKAKTTSRTKKWSTARASSSSSLASKRRKQRSSSSSSNKPSKTTTTSSPSSSPNLLKVLNFATFDFLGMQRQGEDNPIKEASKQALHTYGCGSCGPRGFYGTIDTHLTLEENISKFTSTDGAIMYSDGASTCSSTVAAFAKRGDVLVVDEGVYEPLITGVMLSRANVKWFKHNDMEDLERVLNQIQQNDLQLKRKSNVQRRFIVVEGLYKNLGTICPLDKLIELKHKFNYRLILDESFSFGTLGSTGRGALELYNKRPMYDAEIITIALENSLGSIGGVTVGNEEVVDHQRLSGAGYCFSASAPPFTASAASQSLQLLESQPEVLQQLRTNITFMNDLLRSALQMTRKNTGLYQFVITSDERSPIVVIQLEHETDHEADILSGIAHECLVRGIAVVATGREPVASGHLRTELAPAIRVTLSSLHTKEDIEKAVQVLVESCELVTSRYKPSTSTVASL